MLPPPLQEGSHPIHRFNRNHRSPHYPRTLLPRAGRHSPARALLLLPLFFRPPPLPPPPLPRPRRRRLPRHHRPRLFPPLLPEPRRARSSSPLLRLLPAGV